MKYEHRLECEAPICADDKEHAIWYAGEKICQKTPYSKFQKKQVAINKEVARGTFRHLEEPYNAHALENRSI